MTTTRRTRALALTAAGFGIAVLATGCAAPAPAPTVTVTVTPTAAPAPSPTESPEPAPVPDLAGTALSIQCDTIGALPAVASAVTAGGYAVATEWAPAPGSSAANITAIDGVACAWVTPDQQFVISIGQPDPDTYDYYTSYVASESDPVTFSNGQGADAGAPSGYFTVVDGIGEADAFIPDEDYWISVSGPQFAQPSDLSDILGQLLETLPSG